MYRTYKYRLYPSKAQQATLEELLELARWLYNHALAYRRKCWQESRHTVTHNEQWAMFRDWRNEQPEDNPLRLLSANAGLQVLRRLDSVYGQFMKGQRGFPRFKGHAFFNSLDFTFGNGAGIQANRLYVMNVGLLRVRWHRALPEAGRVKRAVVLRRPSGWYALFQVELPDPAPEPSSNPPVGIDVGITHALALSDGNVADSPQYLKRSLARLRRLQRTVARRERGSQRRKKAVQQLAKEMEHIANRRRDWWHKVTRALVDHYGLIALEDLSLGFMLKNDRLVRPAHDVALGIFYELLGYKAEEAGVTLVKVDPRQTSQLCACCGALVEKTLKERVHACPDCGFTVDRDINAAMNILNRALNGS